VPSLLTPQAKALPALTETKEPEGGETWPEESVPQQASEPSALTPQAKSSPALTVSMPLDVATWQAPLEHEQLTSADG
jgi:hypothetical protein